jgi:Low-density lipoprotein receptor repeat class B
LAHLCARAKRATPCDPTVAPAKPSAPLSFCFSPTGLTSDRSASYILKFELRILNIAPRADLVSQMSLNNVKYTAILKGLHNAIALDYHYNQGLVYWSDVSLDMIRRAHINGSEPEGTSQKYNIVHNIFCRKQQVFSPAVKNLAQKKISRYILF